MSRTRALIAKEWVDLRRNAGALIPAAIITLVSVLLPFAIVVGIPAFTGDALSDDATLERVSAVADPRGLMSSDSRIELFLFQQFLVLLLMTPITGAMSLASHAIIGEKQTRTLEPLLATPLTTPELLLAKMLGALLPTLGMSFLGVGLYVLGIALLGAPGVLAAMATARSAVLVLLVGPAVALVALQSALLISARVNDPRTAQQFGVLFLVPLAILLIAQFGGSLWLSASMLAAIALGLLIAWLLLLLLSAAVFERETILTRWR